METDQDLEELKEEHEQEEEEIRDKLEEEEQEHRIRVLTKKGKKLSLENNDIAISSRYIIS